MKLTIVEPEIYEKAELNACKLLNSKEVNHSWKKDFRKDNEANDDWDIINSDDIRIEIKSNRAIKEFSANRCSLNTKEQHKNIIMKLLIDDDGSIKDYKFVKKADNEWLNITNEILCKK